MINKLIEKLFSRITYSDNTGETLEEAIEILGAKNTNAGVAAEFKYISKIYGIENKDWVFVTQSLIDFENKQFDEIEIKLKSYKSITIFFDVTDFYGT